MKLKQRVLWLLILSMMTSLLSGCVTVTIEEQGSAQEEIPAFSNSPYVVLNDNIPYFTEDDQTTAAYESYGELDSLGRCTVAMACIGQELMPTEERGGIGQVKPSGWQTVTYDFVDGRYLYNRCHLIGFQLTGENANRQNLITGTRYMNVEGMLPFENMVADYIKETGNHVLYRVTPIFQDEELVARGVQMEAQSIEDDEICFCVYVYNNQPGVSIDYATGESRVDADGFSGGDEQEYILNISSKKFHNPDCSGVDSIKEENRQTYTGSRELLLAQGFEPCGKCKP